VAVFALSSPILLMSMGTRNTMINAKIIKESIEITIFASPIRLNMNDFVAK
jgi:hypothetical protein